jgi:hypothetical protein
MQYVTLVNRSSKNLKGTWDGRHYTIAPGQHQFPEIQALKFKEQNPIMGSEDPYTLQKEYLIGIVEHNDDISPTEQTDALERWNRSKLVGAKPVEIVKGNGIYTPSLDQPNRLPSDGGFEPNGGV